MVSEKFKITNTDGKIEFLRNERGIDLYEIKAILDKGDWVDIMINPNYPGQEVYVVVLKNYCYLVPVTTSDKVIKTVWPSRKYTKLYVSSKEKIK